MIDFIFDKTAFDLITYPTRQNSSAYLSNYFSLNYPYVPSKTVRRISARAIERALWRQSPQQPFCATKSLGKNSIVSRVRRTPTYFVARRRNGVWRQSSSLVRTRDCGSRNPGSNPGCRPTTFYKGWRKVCRPIFNGTSIREKRNSRWNAKEAN